MLRRTLFQNFPSFSMLECTLRLLIQRRFCLLMDIEIISGLFLSMRNEEQKS